ncbi:MAG: hypothetical protein ACE5GA_02250 [Candidatus Zixiibacteriota bacterium]
MKNLWAGLMVVSLLALAGCIDYEEKLVINKDGSGTIELSYAIDKSYMNQMQESSAQMAEAMGEEASEADESAPSMFDSSKIDEALKMGYTGMTMLSYESVETDSTVRFKMKYSFEDVNKLYYLYDAIYPDEPGDTTSESAPSEIFTAGANGAWVFDRPLTDGDESDESHEYTGEDDDAGEESGMAEGFAEMSEYLKGAELEGMDKEAMAEAMKGMEAQMRGMEKRMEKHMIKFTVVFPGSVKESNATSVDGNTAVWSFKLNEFSDHRSGLKAVIDR